MMTNNGVRVCLAIGSLIIAAGMIAGFYFVQIPADNMRLVDTALGFAAGFVTMAFGFYFGATPQTRNGEHDNGESNKSRSSVDDRSKETSESSRDSGP